MAAQKKRLGKSEALSLRLDPQLKFALEFAARVRGQTLTAIIERAVLEVCDKVKIRGPSGKQETWKHYWHASDGIRAVKLLSNTNYPTTYHEEELRSFLEAHNEFFWNVDQSPAQDYIEVIWPNVNSYYALWLEERDRDYWAAGKAMAGDLRTAKLKPPVWPRPGRARR